MRIYSIDTIRVVAIIAVILLHIDALKPTGSESDVFIVFRTVWRFSVPFFFLASAYFLALKLRNTADMYAVLTKYIKRLLLVYLFWALFYLLNLPALIHLVANANSTQSLYWELMALYQRALAPVTNNFLGFLVDGGMYHLWFIPALALGLLAVSLSIVFKFERHLFWLAAILYLIDVLFFGWYGVNYVFSIISCAIGLHLSSNSAKGQYRADLGMALAFLGLVINAALVVVFGYDDMNIVVSFGAGSLLMAVGGLIYCLANPALGQSTWLPMLGRFTLGVYVVHPLFDQFLSSLSIWNTGPGIAAFVAAIYFCSVSFAYLLSRFSLTRSLVM
ncbi:MAG: acyltransferase [Gallionellaceae bacterium]|nr:acyltransferase [Gallionellaceae bacterium]